MKHLDVAAISHDPRQRWAFLAEFVGFGDDDWEALGQSVPVLAPRLTAILDALYDHLLGYDDTRRIFLGSDGEVDPRYIAIRKEHLTEWLLETAGGAGDPGAFAVYVMGVGRMHTGVADARRRVPPRYIVALMSYLVDAITTAIHEALPHESAAARRFSRAWTRMLFIQLEMFLKALAPRWDEGSDHGP